MDGQHTRQHGHQDGHRRGGRSGPMTRKATGQTQVYRRVESVTTDGNEGHGNESGDAAAAAAPPATTTLRRVSSDAEPPRVFVSSLQQAIKAANGDDKKDDQRGRKEASPAKKERASPAKKPSPAKRTESPMRGGGSRAGGGGGGGRGGSGGRGGDRSRSPRREPLHSSAGNGRHVSMTTRSERSGSIESTTSTGSSRWVRKPSDYDGDHRSNRQVSSLARSVSGQDARFGDSASRDSRSSSSASLRDGAHRVESGSSYRRVEMSRGSSDHVPFRSSFSNRSRKGSFESDTSDISVRSTSSSRSTRSQSRWDSKSQSGRGGRGRGGRGGGEYGFGSRRSIDDGRRSERGSLTSKPSEERAPPPPVRNFERSTSDHSTTSSHASSAPPPPPPVRGSTLLSSLSMQDTRTPSSSPVVIAKPLVKSTQDFRVTGAAATFKSSLTSSLQANAAPAKEPPVFKSSLVSSVNRDREPPKEAAPVATEVQEPKRLIDRLKERQGDTRSIGASTRGSALSRSDTFGASGRHDPPARTTRPFSGSSILSRVGDRVAAPSPEKENRTREFYAKLDTEDKKRESFRRAAEPLKSSLMSSIARSTVRTAPVVDKRIYSLGDLRALKPTTESPRPSDMRDMMVTDVYEVKPPARAVTASSSQASSRRGDVVSRRGGSKRGGMVSRGGSARDTRQGQSSSRRDGQSERGGRGGGRGGRGGYGPPPPPLYDGPIEPLQVSENRWVPKKADMSVLEATLSHVKSLLNKLTREKFAKLTEELCKTEINSLEILRSIITIIMEKAVEEPSFADVYSDLCKEFHKRTSTKVWSFVRAAQSAVKPGMYLWTAIRRDDTSGFLGPFESEKACIDAAETNVATDASKDTVETTSQDMFKASLTVTSRDLIAVVEASKGSFYYKRKPLDTLTEDEPVLGEWESSEAAMQAAAKQTSFKKLLVTRCQFEFEKSNMSALTTEEDSTDQTPRQKELAIMRAKRRMLGNIRFIGELFKADFLQQSVVQACLFHLLGLQLVKGADDQPTGQEMRSPDEEDIEALCKLLATVGKKYDQPKTQPIMRIVILRLVELSEEPKLPSRTRFLLKDVLEMRDHLWEPRRKEMQQKTLDEVRREAKQLQSQGKNAQHDNVQKRRLKSQVSSVQLAKESSNLLVRKESIPDAPASSAPTLDSPGKAKLEDENDAGKMETRIKSIIQEYTSIHDLDEATTCVRELPTQYRAAFAEEITNRVLEGKDQERSDVVELLVKLYERGAIDATSIQLALVNVLEFLEDIKIDIPLVHQYSALLLGRLIGSGCFGLSWMVSKALAHLVDCGLASLVFAEVLPVIESACGLQTVVRMIADEELSAGSVLPASVRRDDAAVAKYIEEHELNVYFGGDCPHDDHEDGEDELDPDVEAKMRSTLEEYLTVKDLSEVVLCVKELAGGSSSGAELAPSFLWHHFVHVCIMYSLEAKQTTRLEVAGLLTRLVIEQAEDVHVEDVEWAFDAALIDYEDMRVDVPRAADNFAELWVPLFEKTDCLMLTWLHDVVVHLVASGYAAEILHALLTRFETVFGRDKLITWWQQQQPSTPGINWLSSFSGTESSSTSTVIHEKLATWQQVLGPQ